MLLLQHFCRRIYEVYSDYVLKNPFYEVEQVGWGACMSLQPAWCAGTKPLLRICLG